MNACGGGGGGGRRTTSGWRGRRLDPRALLIDALTRTRRRTAEVVEASAVDIDRRGWRRRRLQLLALLVAALPRRPRGRRTRTAAVADAAADHIHRRRRAALIAEAVVAGTVVAGAAFGARVVPILRGLWRTVAEPAVFVGAKLLRRLGLVGRPDHSVALPDRRAGAPALTRVDFAGALDLRSAQDGRFHFGGADRPAGGAGDDPRIDSRH